MYLYKCTLIFIFYSYVNAEFNSVDTPVGTIIGQVKDGYTAYFGIPYARVNLDNPFGSTEPYPHFDTPFNANNSSTICPQIMFQVSGTIQCLQLHIYVPHTAKPDNIKPILIFIHGGGYEFGSGGEYGGQPLVKQDIIVITINYRLGPYGFFCLDDPTVPGNQGLKDQIEALRWVKNNIGAFGGDANKITIAGQSYGGCSVDLHLYSEYETLFGNAIIQSGSRFYKGFYVKPDYQAAIKIATYLGHNVASTKEALTALAKDDPILVISATQNLSLPMGACKEKRFEGVQNFVTSDPFHLVNPDKIKNTKMIAGYTSMENLRLFAYQPQEYWDNLGNVFDDALNKNFVFSANRTAVVSKIIKKFYLGDKAIGPESVIELSEFSSDFVINHSVERAVDAYIAENAQAVYKYLFSYIGGSMYKNITGSGAPHTEELKYLFEWNTPLSGEEQFLVRDRITKLWGNFVKYGDPTPENTNELPVTWIPVKGTTRPYLNIDAELSIKHQVYPKRMAFWNLICYNYEPDSVVWSP